MSQKTGLGTTLTFGTTTGYTPKMSSISGPSESREAYDTSHLGSTGHKQFIPDDLPDGGEVSIDLFWDPAEGKPPVNGPVETITITHNDAGLATEVFPGFITAFEKTMAVGALMVASITIKVAGAITFTP